MIFFCKLPSLHNHFAGQVAVLACGASKQDPLSKTVKNLQEHKSPDPSLPVTYVKPEGNKIQFFVDKDAYTALEE